MLPLGVNVISLKGLRQQIEAHRDCESAALDWFNVARDAQWNSLQDLRLSYPSADQVGGVLIFNLRGNAYRLIVGVNYAAKTMYVKALLSHAEYTKQEWMKWC